MATGLAPLRTVVRPARAADRGFIVALSEEAFVRYARNAGANALAVRDDAHGRGVGQALLANVEDVARERGAVSISLLTADSNVKARALFAHAGYAPLLSVGDAYIDNQPACTFTKALVVGR